MNVRTLLLLLVSNWGFAAKAPDLDDSRVLEKIAVMRDTLEERGPEGATLLYAPESQTPYTGWPKRLDDNYKVKTLGHVKAGKDDGPFVAWHENGQKAAEVTYKDGMMEGLGTGWHDNGKVALLGALKNGGPDGLWTWWDENGEKEDERRY